jgi:hypothetical protein
MLASPVPELLAAHDRSDHADGDRRDRVIIGESDCEHTGGEKKGTSDEGLACLWRGDVDCGFVADRGLDVGRSVIH